jgi:N utilization substance protein B
MAPPTSRTPRSSARAAALMALFGADGDDRATANDLVRHLFKEMTGEAEIAVEPEVRAYAEEIVRGVIAELGAVDGAIRKASTNWRLERMSRVDRNVLRVGTWELLHDVPRAIAIDEAVELGKRFGSEDSGAFVNGVLDRVATDLGK